MSAALTETADNLTRFGDTFRCYGSRKYFGTYELANVDGAFALAVHKSGKS